MSDDLIACIVDALIDDLSGRKGIGDEWYEIDEDIQAEIRAEWAACIKRAAA